MSAVVLSYTRRDQLINLGVEVRRLFAVNPTVFIDSHALDVLFYVASCLGRPTETGVVQWLSSVLWLTANSMAEFRVAPEVIMYVTLSASMTAAGQRCHESLNAVDAFMSLNPVTHPCPVTVL